MDDIKKVFDGIVTFIDGVFSADWKKAWEGITDVFSGVFNGIVDIAKVPLNAVIGAFNGIISIVNSLIGKINGLHFRITVPDWVPGVGGNGGDSMVSASLLSDQSPCWPTAPMSVLTLHSWL